MIGLLIGTACLVGLITTLRRGRGWHGGWRHGGRRGGWGARAALRVLFERLDTSPGQEKVIASVLEDLWTSKREVGEEFIQTRRDVARAMQGTSFDEAALSDAFTRQDALIARLRENMKNAMATVHEALDDRQRKTAGSLLESGGLYMRGGSCSGHRHVEGPYRSASV